MGGRLSSGLILLVATEGVRFLRVERDATFDQRLRGQVYFHLKQHTANLLSTKVEWGAEHEA